MKGAMGLQNKRIQNHMTHYIAILDSEPTQPRHRLVMTYLFLLEYGSGYFKNILQDYII